MVVFRVVLFVILTVSPCVLQGHHTPGPGPRAKDTLQFLVVVSRHGNRGSHKDYAKDPYPLQDAKFWPYGARSLTPYGRVQMYNLGKKIRSLYDGFLNSTFYPEEILAKSTTPSRTIMSGQVFLAGLYPPRGFQVWNKDILWQPAPLYTDSPDNSEEVKLCQKYILDTNTAKAEFFRKYANYVSAIMAEHNQATGANATAAHFWLLWDKLVSEDTEGYKIPEWTESIYPEPFKGLMIEEYIAYYASTDQVLRLIVGNMFEEITNAMTSQIKGSLKTRRIQYYSGHDSTILPLLVILGVPKTDLRIVTPGSALVLELHKSTSTSEPTAQILYIDGASSNLEPVPVPLPSCEDPCPLRRLIHNTEKFVKVDFEKECRVDGLAEPVDLQWS